MRRITQTKESSMSTTARRGRKVLYSTMAVLVLSGGIAQAATVSTTGSHAGNSGRTLTVSDTRIEGDAAYSNWNRNSHNRVQTRVDGPAVSVTPSSLTSFRACRDQGTLNPDNCSDYVGP